MARFQNTGTYRGKGQKRTKDRIASLESNHGVKFSDATDFESKTVATLPSGELINADGQLGRKRVVAAVERRLGLRWISDMGDRYGHYPTEQE